MATRNVITPFRDPFERHLVPLEKRMFSHHCPLVMGNKGKIKFLLSIPDKLLTNSQRDIYLHPLLKCEDDFVT